VSPHDAGTVYVAATRYKWNDMAPYIFKSTDYGKTWEKRVDGVPAESWAHVVREDPVRKDLLYAGTEHGIFVSFNGGRTWQSLQLNLPVTPVTDLQVHRSGDLVAATSGRAFWILDDVSPLRQAAENLGPVHLFQPRAAVRTNLGAAGANLPPRLGKNPPAGAILDFYLAKEGTVKLEIRDSAGDVVRTYSNEKKEGQTNPDLKVKIGMNRTNWDLRYDTPAAIPGVFLFGGVHGRKAIPGMYEVRLTAAGETKTAKLEVRDDPRVKTTPRQYAEQSKLLGEVFAAFDDLHKSVIRLRAVRTQIEDLVKRASDKNVESAGKALAEKLTAEEDALIQKRTVDMQTVINFPVRLDHHLLVLANDVDDSGELTDGARKRAADLLKQWNEHKTTLAGLFGSELDAFNKQVAGAKVPHVTVPK